MDLCSDRQKQLGAGPTGTPQDAIARDESAKETRLPVLVRGCCKLQGGGGRRSAGRRFSWGRRGSRSASFSFNEEPHIRRCAQSCCLGLRKYGIHGRAEGGGFFRPRGDANAAPAGGSSPRPAAFVFLSVARIRGGPFCCSHKRY